MRIEKVVHFIQIHFNVFQIFSLYLGLLKLEEIKIAENLIAPEFQFMA